MTGLDAADCSGRVAPFGGFIMRACALSLLLLAMASSVNAGVLWDESVDGPLSFNPDAPTPVTFAIGSNIISGNVGGIGPGLQRDYITFLIPAGQKLTTLNLLVFNPDNTAFAAFNYGPTSVVPRNETIGFWVSGIHINTADVGFDLMEFFYNRSLTTESLPESELTLGRYCFVIQQTSGLTNTYSLEFVVTGTVTVDDATWGKIKAMYR
jgi:hypothetical protein